MVLESTTWMTRRKRRANPLPRRPAANPGECFWRCLSTVQKSRSASAASRRLLAWERLLRLGAVAPRKAESGPLWSRSASQTSLRPMAWVSCAKSMLTTWLHGLKDRAMEATPVSRASFGTRCGGIRLQSCRRTVNFDAVGLVFLFFTFVEWQS